MPEQRRPPWSSFGPLSRRPLALGLVAAALVHGLGAGTGVLMARALGPHDRGVLAAALLGPQLLTLVGGLGIAEALTVHIARAARHTGAALLGAAAVLTAMQAGALTALGLALLAVAARRAPPGASALMMPALAFIPVYLAAMALIATLAGLRRFALVHVIRLLVNGGYALALGALLLKGRLTPLTALRAYLGAHLLAGLVAAVACARWPGFRPAGWRAAVRPLLAYGLRSHLGTLCAAVCERADQAAVAVLLPPTRLGAYLAAVSLTAPVGLVGAAVAATALPVVAAASAGDAQVAVAQRYVACTVALVLLLGVPLVVGAPWLVALCFGPAFRDAALPARLLAPGAGAWSVGRVLGAVLRAVGAPGAAARCDLVAALAVVGGLLVLTPRWGLNGAAAAVSLGSLGGTAVAVSATARALRGNDRRGAVPACVPLTARSAALTPSPAGGGPLGCPGGHGEPRG